MLVGYKVLKACKSCSHEQDVKNFQKGSYNCNKCRAEVEKNRRARNRNPLTEVQKEARRESSRKWRRNNLEKAILMSRNTDYKRKYGITIDDYNMMLELQSGVCAICSQECKTEKNLAVDHDHKNGQIRALLCKNCNTGLGSFNDNIENMQKAIDYVKSYSNIEVNA